MTAKHLFVLFLALFASAMAQNDDELHIPDENDNQFPPDNHPESDGSVIEGSGADVIDEPLEATTGASAPLLENVQLTALADNVPTVATEEHSCPQPCVCNIEGNTNKYIVDCSGYGLTELPKPLDAKTTELNLENNKLTEIPKEISDLKDLKILNANNNEIMKIVSGSISELPELISLKLGNNRLIEYPQDLKNSFGLTKLEVLDLGGNDMRTDLKPESFSNFKALRSVTLPTDAASLVADLCTSLKDSLVTVCTGSCNTKSFECPDAPQTQGIEYEQYISIPALIPLIPASDDDVDPVVNSSLNVKADNDTQKNKQTPPVIDVETSDTVTLLTKNIENPIGDISPHSTIIKKTEDPKTDADSTSATTVKSESEPIRATISETKPGVVDQSEIKMVTSPQSTIIKPKPTDAESTSPTTVTGGVDKSVIGMVVAAMVLVVAGITIKKNWSSIRNRFSSTPRNTNDRTSVNANGTTPEEVPLQEKSPV